MGWQRHFQYSFMLLAGFPDKGEWRDVDRLKAAASGRSPPREIACPERGGRLHRQHFATSQTRSGCIDRRQFGLF